MLPKLRWTIAAAMAACLLVVVWAAAQTGVPKNRQPRKKGDPTTDSPVVIGDTTTVPPIETKSGKKARVRGNTNNFLIVTVKHETDTLIHANGAIGPYYVREPGYKAACIENVGNAKYTLTLPWSLTLSDGIVLWADRDGGGNDTIHINTPPEGSTDASTATTSGDITDLTLLDEAVLAVGDNSIELTPAGTAPAFIIHYCKGTCQKPQNADLCAGATTLRPRAR